MDVSPIQQIKDRLDIVEVISSYLKLEKTGANLRAPCPFHSEKKPSFFVSPTRQMFRCFGCGVGGDMFQFVMQIEGIEFGDALRILARRAGVELRSFQPEMQTRRARLYEICELGCRFFEKQLEKSIAGQAVREYLLRRGLIETTIKQWRLGYSPAPSSGGWRALSDFLVSQGYKREEILEAGLAVQSEKAGTPYDRFRGRIMFPIFDLNSQVIGFGGRITEEQQKAGEDGGAKYINISTTPLYDKGKALYGLNFAKVDVRKKDACILTEGYMDVILSHQAGFTNTVAVSGTALTSYQLKIIKRYTGNLLAAFDMDTAGGLATTRGIDLAQQEDFVVKVIVMPSEKDPADIISQEPSQWEKAIGEAKEIMEFYFENALARFDCNSPQGKKEIANFLLPFIKKIANRIVQAHWLQKLASLLNVSEGVINEELNKINLPQNTAASSAAVAAELAAPKINPKNRKELLEEKILALALKNPENLNYLHDEHLLCFSQLAKDILFVFKKANVSSQILLTQTVAELGMKGAEFKFILDSCAFKAEIEEDENPAEEFQICLQALQSLSTQEKLQEITAAIRLAEQKGDAEKVKNLVQQFHQLANLKKI